MNLTINRKKWSRGNVFPTEETSLLTERGHMCCLGFYCRKIGYTKSSIVDQATPQYIMPIKRKLKVLLTKSGRDNDLCGQLISANDSRILDEKDREKQIKKLMKEMNVDVTFIN